MKTNIKNIINSIKTNILIAKHKKNQNNIKHNALTDLYYYTEQPFISALKANKKKGIIGY